MKKIEHEFQKQNERQKSKVYECKVVWDVKWSGSCSEAALCENSQSLWHTHETQGPSTSVARSHMPQLLTVFPLRLSSAGPQKCDFGKSHSRREYKVVYSLAHSWDTGPKHKRRTLSHATTLYGYPIWIIQWIFSLINFLVLSYGQVFYKNF